MELTVVLLASQNPQENQELKRLLRLSLGDIPHRLVSHLGEVALPNRLLFAVPLGEDGINIPYLTLLAKLRNEENLMKSSLAGLLIQADSPLYGKEMACNFAFALNQAGCALVGNGLVESRSCYQEFDPLFSQHMEDVHDLALRLVEHSYRGTAPLSQNPDLPHLVVVFPVGEEHASLPVIANSYELWDELKQRLYPFVHCHEICLSGDTVGECNDCVNRNCRRFIPDAPCFYGSALKQEEMLALNQCDALLVVAPFVEHSIHSSLLGFIQQLATLFSPAQIREKALFSLVLTETWGGEMVVAQLISALSMAQGFYLPAPFALVETEQDTAELFSNEETVARLDQFAHGIIQLLNLGKLS